MTTSSYREAGVDIDKKAAALEGIGALARSTFTPRVLHELGSFGGMFAARFEGLADPVLVATTDSVGTKVRTALRAGRMRGLGHDIVNHCVNDVLVQGAEPLFFLDYYAAGVLEPAVFTEVVAGVAEACREVGAALLGGETAEMPGVYAEGEIDLVGFLVGVVERARVWPRDVAPGDALVGVASSGLHTNGFSLVNRILSREGPDLAGDPGGFGESLADALLRPHRSYLAAIRSVRDALPIHALAHITGGGLQDNLPRVLPRGVGAEVDRSTWTPPPVFGWIMERAAMSRDEAWHVLNMGCGLVVVVDAGAAADAVAALEAQGERAFPMGHLVEGEGVRFLGG